MSDISEEKSHLQEEPAFDDSLFDMLPEGTRIIIKGSKVTFENLTPDMLDVAKSLNPDDKRWHDKEHQS